MSDERKLTGEELAAIKARADAATEGPWFRNEVTRAGKHITFLAVPGLGSDDIGRNVWDEMRCADHEFIAFSRTDIPALLSHAAVAEAEPAVRSENARLRAAHGHLEQELAMARRRGE